MKYLLPVYKCPQYLCVCLSDKNYFFSELSLCLPIHFNTTFQQSAGSLSEDLPSPSVCVSGDHFNSLTKKFSKGLVCVVAQEPILQLSVFIQPGWTFTLELPHIYCSFIVAVSIARQHITKYMAKSQYQSGHDHADNSSRLLIIDLKSDHRV